MKTLIPILIGLVMLGCAAHPTVKSVVGTYGDDTIRMVFIENGELESYVGGKKIEDAKWKIIDGEIHIINEGGISIGRINHDGSLTEIGKIPEGGKRTNTPEEYQLTLKKIK